MTGNPTPTDAVREFNAKWLGGPRIWGVPVVYRPVVEREGRYVPEYTTVTQGLAYLNSEGEPRIRLADYAGYRTGASLYEVTVLEEAAAKLRQLKEPEGEDAIQRYPECPNCLEEMPWDEGFECQICLQRFDSNGLHFVSRRCVEYECMEEAQVVGEDGQPRCISCQSLVIVGELEPFGPYECKKCSQKVVGMPAESKAGRARLCGLHQSAEEEAARRRDLLAGLR